MRVRRADYAAVIYPIVPARIENELRGSMMKSRRPYGSGAAMP